MEIVGVVAGIPGLIHIVQGLTATLRGLANRRSSAQVAGELLSELTDIENILKDVQLRWKSNPTDKSQLQRLAPVLSQLRTEFASLQSTLQIKFSKEPSSFLRRALPLSTKLDKTLKESLNRVSQVKTSLTLIITHHHDRMAEEHLKISSSDLQLTLRSFLRPSGDNFIPQRSEETCEWIWSHPAFTPWITKPPSPSTDPYSRIFCLYGPKGCGKSVLVKSIAEQLRGRGKLVSHFPFWAGSETQRRFLDFLRSLLWQLLSPLSAQQVRVITSPLIADPSTNEANILTAINLALAASTTDFYCLVDGIDESLDDWNSRGQGCLKTILSLVSNHPRFHLLVAGREPSLRTLLADSKLKIEVTEDCTRSDINKFIATELDHVLTIQTPEVRQLVLKSLQENSQVMFLWTTLILNQLRRCYTIEEIRNTLEQVPHDLDREYHRLFRQLMTRTRGTQAKPSPSMNRARILLTSILASPEPLTADELRYAYAAHVHNGNKLDDGLIPVDGIIDACGDFVRITDGRYHLIHASLIDFLLRSSDEWNLEDADIQYFRVERAAAHKHMVSVCVDYLELLDLGYPLTDGGATSLPTKYPFFAYTTELLPYFFVRTLNHGDSTWAHSELYRAVKTPQACALVEYALATIQGSLQPSHVDRFHYWSELVSAKFEWRWGELLEAYETELRRRLQCFGPDDTRYQVWQSISTLIANYYPQPADARPNRSVSSSRQAKSSHVTRLFEGRPLPVVLEHVAGDIGPHGQKVSQALRTFSKVFRGLGIPNLKSMTSDLLALSPDVLPVPFVFVMFAMACTRQDWASAERLAGTALRRTRGSNTFWECLSLVCLTAMSCLTRTEGYDEARQLAQESIRMTARSPSQPHFHGARIAGYLILTVLCIRDRRDEEARDALRCVESLVGVDRQKSGSRIFETLCRTRPGRGWRMIALIWIAWEYNQKQSHMDAAKLLDRALAIYEGASATDQPTRPTRSCFLLQRMAFWDASDMPACINTCRQLLQFLDGLPQSRVDEVNTHHRRDTYKFIGWCYARLDNFNEARGAFRHAAEGVYLLDISKHKARMNDLPNLAMGLLLIGDYEKSASTIRKTLGPDHISHKEGSLLDTDLGRLQPLADTIEQMGVFDFDHRSFIRGASLLKAAQLSAADEPSAEIDWWIDAALNLEDPPVPAFRYQRIILLLKAIDILLCDTNCAERAFFYYRDVAASLAGMGNQSAASLVTVDGASRYFTNHSESFWQGLVLLADAALYDRRFQQALLRLRAAWDVYRCDCFTDWDLLCYFVDEYVSDCEYIHKTETAGDETARIERPFLEQACALLAQARELSIDMHRSQIRTRIGDKKEDSSVAEETLQSREARHTELESRLVDLEAGPLLVAARASREALATTVKKEKRRIRRVRSFAGSVSDLPRVVCWRAYFRSRSLESLRGVPG